MNDPPPDIRPHVAIAHTDRTLALDPAMACTAVVACTCDYRCTCASTDEADDRRWRHAVTHAPWRSLRSKRERPVRPRHWVGASR